MRRLLKPKLKHVFATVYTGKCCCCFEKWELKHKVVLLCMWRSRSVTGYVAPLVTCNAVVYGGREHTTTNFPFYFLEFHKNSPIERFHSRGQQVCKFNGTIESVYIRKEFNSHRIGSEGQHSFNRDLTTRQRRRPWKRHWKMDFASFHTISRLSQVALLHKRREFRLELKRGDRARVQTGIVELTPLQFPF